MTLLPVIAHIGKQHDKIKRLVEHCRKLDGTELLVIPVGPEIERLPYPAGAERVRHEVMRQMRHQAFLWLEVDSVPFRPGWLKAISEEYERVQKPFLLPSLVGAPTCDFASGIGIYPPDAVNLIPASFKGQSFDGWIYKNLPHAIHFTRLIQHSYAHYENGVATRKHSFPLDAGILRPDAMIFHADPAQTLIHAGSQFPVAMVEKYPNGFADPVVTAERSFYHSGDFGDVIAALPVIRHLGGGALYIGPHRHAGRSPREGINQTRFESIVPLLREQTYLTKVEYCEHPPAEAVDFSSFREIDPLDAENLTAWQARHVGVIGEIDMSTWLTTTSVQHNEIVVARSLRYQTPSFPWPQILRKHSGQLVFVGRPEEHQAFENQIGRIKFAPTRSLFEAAQVIAGSKFVFANQSAPWWLAAGLGKLVIQETNSDHLNSIVPRPGLVYTSTPQELQHIVDSSR